MADARSRSRYVPPYLSSRLTISRAPGAPPRAGAGRTSDSPLLLGARKADSWPSASARLAREARGRRHHGDRDHTVLRGVRLAARPDLRKLRDSPVTRGEVLSRLRAAGRRPAHAVALAPHLHAEGPRRKILTSNAAPSSSHPRLLTRTEPVEQLDTLANPP